MGRSIEFTKDFNQGITIPHKNILSVASEPYTIELWFKPKKSSSVQILIDKNNGGYGDYLISLDTTGAKSILRFAIGAPSSTTTYTVIDSTIDKWTHLAYRVSGEVGAREQTVFINGVQVITTNFTTVFSPNISPVGLAKTSTTDKLFFNGFMAEVRLWRRSRTNQEILDNMLKVNPNETGLVAYWRLNENNGTAILDSTTNESHGNLINDPIRSSDGPFLQKTIFLELKQKTALTTNKILNLKQKIYLNKSTGLNLSQRIFKENEFILNLKQKVFKNKQASLLFSLTFYGNLSSEIIGKFHLQGKQELYLEAKGGIDMTQTGQDFSMISGDTKILIVTIDEPTNLAGVSLRWGLRKNKNTKESLFVKSLTDGISIEGETISVKLEPIDTESLTGDYYHEMELTDGLGNVSTIFTGKARIETSGV